MEVINTGRRNKKAGAGAMQLAGCDRMHEETTRSRTGNTTPRERMTKRRMQATVHAAGGR
jgi:hypothetical protein